MKQTKTTLKHLMGKMLAMLLPGAVLVLLLAFPAIAAPSLSQKSVTLQAGDGVRLEVSGYNGSVKWTSSKKTVAKVNSAGVVTTKKKGSAVITAKCGKKKLKCKIKVTAASPKSIVLNAGAISMKKGASYSLKATVTPKAKWNIKWKTSNKSSSCPSA